VLPYHNFKDASLDQSAHQQRNTESDRHSLRKYEKEKKNKLLIFYSARKIYRLSAAAVGEINADFCL
jgi:hypothetical protein